MRGRWIIVTSWVAVGVFAVTIVPNAAGLDALDGLAAGVALGLFLAGLIIWFYAFGLAVLRSARGDEIGVANLCFLQGSAPSDVRRQLFAALAISCIVAVATVWANAFAVLEPMFPLALMTLWAARYGTFHARSDMGAGPSVRAPQRGAA